MKWLVIVFNAHKHVSRVTCSIQFTFYVLVHWWLGYKAIFVVIATSAVAVRIFVVSGVN